jgi:hypothetical protein
MKAILVFFCLIAISSFSQQKNDSSIIRLLDSSRIKNQKLITLIDTDKFIVITTYSVFIKEFKKWLISCPNIDEDKMLYNSIIKDTNSKSVNAIEIALKINNLDRLNFRTAELLNRGNCWVFDKLKNKGIRKIKILNYFDHSIEGTKYFIKEELILDVIERVY